MAERKFDFDPLRRAESLMADLNGSRASAVSVEVREQAHDLILLSMAKSLDALARRARFETPGYVMTRES